MVHRVGRSGCECTGCELVRRGERIIQLEQDWDGAKQTIAQLEAKCTRSEEFRLDAIRSRDVLHNAMMKIDALEAELAECKKELASANLFRLEAEGQRDASARDLIECRRKLDEANDEGQGQ